MYIYTYIYIHISKIKIHLYFRVTLTLPPTNCKILSSPRMPMSRAPGPSHATVPEQTKHAVRISGLPYPTSSVNAVKVRVNLNANASSLAR